MSQSEVARIKQQIEAEYLAAKLGLTGLSYGAAKHDFIEKRTENLGRLHDELQGLIGEEAAMKLLVETIEKLPDKPLRHIVVIVLRKELEANEETEHLIDKIEGIWNTIDTLIHRFGEEDTNKIMHARLGINSLVGDSQ